MYEFVSPLHVIIPESNHVHATAHSVDGDIVYTCNQVPFTKQFAINVCNHVTVTAGAVYYNGIRVDQSCCQCWSWRTTLFVNGDDIGIVLMPVAKTHI